MNYDLLFEKCAHIDINLNWIIYGDEVIHQLHPGEEGRITVSTESLDKRAVRCVEMIQSLPWSISARRELIENYISIVHEEVQKHSDSKMWNARGE
jgi:hypothetical protein